MNNRKFNYWSKKLEELSQNDNVKPKVLSRIKSKLGIYLGRMQLGGKVISTTDTQKFRYNMKNMINKIKEYHIKNNTMDKRDVRFCITNRVKLNTVGEVFSRVTRVNHHFMNYLFIAHSLHSLITLYGIYDFFCVDKSKLDLSKYETFFDGGTFRW